MPKLVDTMSEDEKARRVAEELLFSVLDFLGEPIVMDIDRVKKIKIEGRAIDIDFDQEAGTVTLQVVDQ